MRQNIIAPYKKVSNDIVIITIDDKSYEGLTQKFGEWPVPRGVYAKLVNELQKQGPKVITFDLMFVNPMRYMKENDAALIEVFKKNKNLYTVPKLSLIDQILQTNVLQMIEYLYGYF